MKSTLKPGLTHEFKFKIPENKTVPYLYPEAPELQEMPKVLATGFMVGLFEWTCIQAINPHIDWPREQTVGIDIKLSHLAATPPGLSVVVKVELKEVEGRKLVFSIVADDGIEKEVEGRKLVFSIVADDGIDKISEGTHHRFIIDAAKFNAKLAAKINPK